MRLHKYQVYSTIVIACLTSPMLSPVFALDYEAKPVHNVLVAPVRILGAVTGGAVCGLFSGPVDNGFHKSKKATSKIAGDFGDENGKTEILAAAPVAVPLGVAVGGVRGFGTGVAHGAKLGWEKPFSRWSYVTMDEKGKSTSPSSDSSPSTNVENK